MLGAGHPAGIWRALESSSAWGRPARCSLLGLHCAVGQRCFLWGGGIKLAGLGPRFTKDLLKKSTFWEIFTNDLLRIYYGNTKEIAIWEIFTKDVLRIY